MASVGRRSSRFSSRSRRTREASLSRENLRQISPGSAHLEERGVPNSLIGSTSFLIECEKQFLRDEPGTNVSVSLAARLHGDAPERLIEPGRRANDIRRREAVDKVPR